jgi:hypothetical protein
MLLQEPADGFVVHDGSTIWLADVVQDVRGSPLPVRFGDRCLLDAERSRKFRWVSRSPYA